MSASAAAEYLTRLDARRAARDALTGAEARLAHARLATFVLMAIVAIVAWRGALSAWWLLAPGAMFLWLVHRHDQVLRRRDAASRGIEFYERGLDRIGDRWAGTGDPGDRFRDDSHPYANDLDLFGRGSLFELLSLARTRTGEATLAQWLTLPADAPEIRARQEAIEELGPALDLREQLRAAGADVRASVQTDSLLAWAGSPARQLRALRLFTWCSSAATCILILYMAFTSTWWPLGALVVMQAVVLSRMREQLNAALSANDPSAGADFVADPLAHRVRDLDVLADLLTHLERERFDGSRLALLRSRLTADDLPASRIIRGLHRLSRTHDSQKNATVVPLMLFMFGQIEAALSVAALLQLLRPHVAVAVNRWQRRHGARVRVWIETVAQFEALCSLASYRYEHEEDPFPDVVSTCGETPAQARFEGTQLGHPLLPHAAMVRNDVSLGGDLRLLVVSGSNMSGKSTLLRTVGINAVLALAGAPVRAVSLRLSPLATGGTLRIQDSLQEGRSRFYAEITRIRTLADVASGPVPLLFLLDELFHGTNSHDRLVGSAGVLRSLLDRGAIGLITTHDLALTAVADALGPRAANVHFEDRLDEHDLTFDYRMKPGPVVRSNAIALMRAVGLDVPSAT